MISVSAATAGILAGSSMITGVRVESWLGNTLLDSDVPVETGGEEVDRTGRVPERVTLTVPRLHRGVSYAPTSDDSPLAANGQRLRVLLSVGARGNATEWIQRGWFVINASNATDNGVDVEAGGMLTLIDEARLVSPYQPSGSMASTLRSLIEPALTADVSGGPSDRTVPSTLNFDDSRLDAVYALLDAWAAEGRVNEDGVFVVTPSVASTTTVLTLSRTSTVTTASGESSREGVYNAVVARGQAADGGAVQGVAYEYTGPKRINGDWNPLPVPYFFDSPLLTSIYECNQAAATILRRIRRRAGRRINVEAVPDFRIQAGDVVRLTADDYSVSAATVESIRLPYTADGGAMVLGLQEVIT
jgi:hypothetical protein